MVYLLSFQLRVNVSIIKLQSTSLPPCMPCSIVRISFPYYFVILIYFSFSKISLTFSLRIYFHMRDMIETESTRISFHQENYKYILLKYYSAWLTIWTRQIYFQKLYVCYRYLLITYYVG